MAIANSPDLPGCVATRSTREEVEREITAAIAFHLEGLRALAELDRRKLYLTQACSSLQSYCVERLG